MASIEMMHPVAVEFGPYLFTAWTTACSRPETISAWAWTKFLLFAPCPQRVLVSSLHLIFVALLGIYAVTGLITVRGAHQNGFSKSLSLSGVRISPIYSVQVAFIVLVMLLQWCVAGWRVAFAARYNWCPVPAQELVYSLGQALTWTVFAAIVGHQKKFCATVQSKLLRTWWIMTFLFSLLTLHTSIARYMRDEVPRDVHLWIDGIVSIATFPVVVLLALVAMVGRTGISVEESHGHLEESLLGCDAGVKASCISDDDTDFATASFISKAMWLWLNPLLKKGKSLKALEPDDVPLLPPEDRSDELYSRFVVNFEYQPLWRALLRTFWPQLVFTAFLSVSKLCVMYVGPILITHFVTYVAGNELFPHEGLALVVILFTAKTVEVLSVHHFNFYSQRLSMVVRSSLMTTVYRKGLRLSSSGHGGGQIVNYMSVDVQQIGDLMSQMHNIWVLPLQTAVALVILYAVIGVSCFSGVFVMLCILFVSFNVAKLHQGYQAMIMKFKHKRMAATTEALNNMKIIKLQAWEDLFKDKIQSIRNSEGTWLAKFMYVLAMNVFFLWLSPLAVSTATFALCVLLDVPLTPAKVFTTISTFRILQEPLRLFPQAVMAISQAAYSFDRLEKYMWSREVDANAVERLPLGGGSYDVEIEDGSFKWALNSDRVPTLKGVNVKVQHGAFVAIVGMVGSGKSALLSAVLGEIPKLSGSVKVRGRIAYVGQSAWIQSATIKDNILFGKELDEDKFQETIRVCLLAQDLAQMTFGENTEIGVRGINLSEGQKQRIQLARAVYQDLDVYILDDVFSAVDAHARSYLFKECIVGALGKKTVLLVTQQVEFLQGADLILVLRNGEIVQSGKYNDLLEAGADFGDLVAAHNEGLMNRVSEMECSLKDSPLVVVDSDSTPILAKQSSQNGELSKCNAKTLNCCRRRSGEVLPVKRDSNAVSKKGKVALKIDDEKRASSDQDFSVYWLYATKACKGFHVLVLLILQSCWQGLQIGSDYWLAHSTADPTNFQPSQFITVYSELTLGSGLFVLLRSLFTAFEGLMTAQSFFVSLLSCIMRAPMTFFDTTPSGRIFTRFSSDQSNVDFLLPILLGTVLCQGFQALGILVVVCQVTWQMIFLIVPLAYVYFLVQRHYIATSRELTRIESITKAPVLVHFYETISGIVAIRAFGEQPRFAAMNMERVDANLKVDFHSNAANEWLGFRLEMVGTVVLASSALFMVTVARNIIGSELVGLSLSYGLALNGCLSGVIYLACQLDNKMVSVERINQYCGITSEAPPVIEDSRPAESWPSQGNIQFHRLQLRPDAPLGISLNIKGGEKVGVVGRTGSGKSTLIQALFRLVDMDGRIVIDNLDTQLIGLKDLRTKLGVIPQEPTLFEGTIRFNIDPFQEHSDREIWEALENCQLAGMIKDKTGKLDSVAIGNGEKWSVGQRQLFFLARALLKKAKILVFHASVDAQTDTIIQQIIHSEFANATVISIAHRIPTVMDSDKVLVLDSGLVKEFDAPSRLLEQPDSLFAALLREYLEQSGPNE